MGPARQGDGGRRRARRPDPGRRRPGRGRRRRGRDGHRRRAARSVTPGFIDPHGHSDGSLFVDGALISHLAPGLHDPAVGQLRRHARADHGAGASSSSSSLRPNGLTARWRTFAEYLDAVERESLGPKSRSSSVTGRSVDRSWGRGRAPDADELPPWSAKSRRRSRPARSASRRGLIYAPGMHAGPDELATLVCRDPPSGLYATHMRNEAAGLFAALDEAMAADPGRGRRACRAACRSRTSSAGRAAVWGRAGEAVAVLEAARADGLDVAADQYPYTAAATTLARPAARPAGSRASMTAWRRSATATSATACGRDRRGTPAGRTWRPTRAGPGSASRSRRVIRTGRAARSPTRRGPGRRPGRSRVRRAARRPARRQRWSSTAWPTRMSRSTSACP